MNKKIIKNIGLKFIGISLKSICMGILIAGMIWIVTKYPSEFGGIKDLTAGVIIG